MWSEAGPLLFSLEQAEGNAAHHVVALAQTARRERLRKTVRVRVQYGNPLFRMEVLLKVFSQFRIKFEKQEVGIPVHPSEHLSGMTALTRSKLGDHP
jgi:hypothetical protein